MFGCFNLFPLLLVSFFDLGVFFVFVFLEIASHESWARRVEVRRSGARRSEVKRGHEVQYN